MRAFDADPGTDPDYCDRISIDEADERADEAREIADQAEADAARAREFPQWTDKGAA